MARKLTVFASIFVPVSLGIATLSADAMADLRNGAVYSMSNARDGNEVVAFERASNGTLTRVGSFPTGGTGSGSFEDTANGLVLGSAEGESAPNNLIEASELLFATNAGSNTISVFSVLRDRLALVEQQDSQGEKPISITINDGLVYVLNSGERVDDLIDENGEVITNCTTGMRPTVTGFRVSERGRLTPIADSTRRLSGPSFSGCAQVSFNPTGDLLVVTEREVTTQRRRAQGGEGVTDEGVIVTFVVRDDGTLGGQTVVDATGQGPFGFTFTKAGLLLTSEQFDGIDGPGRGAAAAYSLSSDGMLEPTSGSVDNGGTDSCWFVVTDDGRLGFVTSFFGDGRISSYEIGPEGDLSVLEADAAGALGQGASDIALSRDSEYLYQLNSFEGTINAFHVGEDGSLSLVQTVQAHDPSPVMAERLGIAAF